MKQLKKLGLLAIALIVASLSIVACSKKDDPKLSEEALIGTAWSVDYYYEYNSEVHVNKNAYVLKFDKGEKLYTNEVLGHWHITGEIIFLTVSNEYKILRFSGSEMELLDLRDPNLKNRLILRKI